MLVLNYFLLYRLLVAASFFKLAFFFVSSEDLVVTSDICDLLKPRSILDIFDSVIDFSVVSLPERPIKIKIVLSRTVSTFKTLP